MIIRRGCGCPILILGVFNLLMVGASIVSLFTSRNAVTGQSQATTLGAVLFLLIFVGNLVACVVIGLAALRGGSGRPESDTGLPDEGEETATDSVFESDSSSESED